MNDRPILFSGPMIRALLDGRKTQTRRVLRPTWKEGANQNFTGWVAEQSVAREWVIKCTDIGARVRVPFSRRDRLWVRETHAIVPSSAYRCSPGVPYAVNADDPDLACVYRAGWERSRPGRWRPSIHMPRWASRLTLVVTDVRVQRVQQISDEDARDEGVNRLSKKVRQFWLFGADAAQRNAIYLQACRWEFEDLWNSLNEPRGYGWDANPWVVAITFTVHRQNIDQLGNE